jgi:CRP-like cAMP-binding protein
MKEEEFFSVVFTAAGLTNLLQKQPLSNRWIDLLDAALEPRKLPKGQILLNFGQTPEYIYFLKEGAIIGYHLDSEGKAHSLFLWDNSSIVTEICGYITQQPSDLRIDICNNSELLQLHRSAIDNVIKQYPEALQFLFAIQSNFLNYHRERDKDRQHLNAKQRIEKLFAGNKTLGLKFSKISISTLLGISDSHYSDLTNNK